MMLEGKAAIVSGASRGIGRAIALRLMHEGAHVLLAARDEKALLDVASQSRGESAVVPCDLRKPESAEQVVNTALEHFGGIDILINNAGATKRGDFESLSEEDWQDGFALKFFGAVRLTRAAWPHLRARSGSLVNIAGAGGRTPGPQFTIGGSVNAALLSFTKAMADLGIRDNVQVNTINPGPVKTDRLARRLQTLARERNLNEASALEAFIREEKVLRIGEPEDIAALVAFVLSPHGRYIHGSLIDADGGSTKTV
jgi:NAD(P)-dependent dehydrogenase (short-subunit alcohol dehydrogenase family)